jgi:hypothetical protein
VLAASIIKALEAASTSETSVNCQTTRCNIPEDSYLHTRRRENLRAPYFQFSQVFLCALFPSFQRDEF